MTGDRMKRWAALLLCALFLLASPAREVRRAWETQPVEAGRYIALTFDDGPGASTTPELLRGLADRGVRATFFLIGRQIPGNEEIVKQMAGDGHQIGVHTYDHVALAGAQEEEVRAQIEKTEALLTEILGGEEDWWLRPPYGRITSREAAWITTPMVQWTIDPEDWKIQDAEKVTDHILAHAGDGEIILLHDVYGTSVTAALAVVDALQAEGYTFLTLRELFRMEGVEPQGGVFYRTPTWIASLE